MKCSGCGESLPDGALYCGVCGGALAAASLSSSFERLVRASRRRVWPAGLLLLLNLALLGGSACYFGQYLALRHEYAELRAADALRPAPGAGGRHDR